MNTAVPRRRSRRVVGLVSAAPAHPRRILLAAPASEPQPGRIRATSGSSATPSARPMDGAHGSDRPWLQRHGGTVAIAAHLHGIGAGGAHGSSGTDSHSRVASQLEYASPSRIDGIRPRWKGRCTRKSRCAGQINRCGARQFPRHTESGLRRASSDGFAHMYISFAAGFRTLRCSASPGNR
jgi:hypothetical protein